MEIQYVAKVHYRAAQFPENPRVAAAGDKKILPYLRNRRGKGHRGMLGYRLRIVPAPIREADKGLSSTETDSQILPGLHGRVCPTGPRMHNGNLLVLAVSVWASA